MCYVNRAPVVKSNCQYFREVVKERRFALTDKIVVVYKLIRLVLLIFLTCEYSLALASTQSPFNKGWELYQKGDFGGALAKWKPLADKGDARAQFNLGVMYDEGRGVLQSREDAVLWWKKAAKSGNPHAKHNLGLAYLSGDGVERNFKLAMTWFREAAVQGMNRSQYSLGKIYGAGLGNVLQDDEESFAWISKAAKSGFDRAQYNLGKMFRDGKGVRKDRELAVKWFRAAAEQGYAKAQRNLGNQYLVGDGVRQDNTRAYFWLTLAADAAISGAAKNRDLAATKLTKGERHLIEIQVRNWQPKPANQVLR